MFENLLDKTFGAQSLGSQVLKKTQAKAPVKTATPTVFPAIPTMTSTPAVVAQKSSAVKQPDFSKLPTPYTKSPTGPIQPGEVSPRAFGAQLFTRTADIAAKGVVGIARTGARVASEFITTPTQGVFPAIANVMKDSVGVVVKARNDARGMSIEDPYSPAPMFPTLKVNPENKKNVDELFGEVIGYNPEKKQNVSGLMKSFEKVEPSLPTTKLAEFTQKQTEKPYMQPSEEYKNATWTERLTKHLPETLQQVGSQAGASSLPYLINPVAGIAISAGSYAEDKDRELRKAGITDPIERQNRIIPYAIAYAVVERLMPEEKLFAKQAGTVIQKVNRQVAQVAKGGAEEDIQEAIDIELDKTYREVTGKEIDQRMKDSLVAGILGTGLVGGTSAAVQSVQEKGMKAGFSVEDVSNTNAPQPVIENKKTIYHGTDKIFDDFDITKSADGSIWFTDNKSKIENGEVAASGKGRVMERVIDENNLKLGGWEENDKFTQQQLIEQGYDGLKLPDQEETTYQIFNPEKLSVPAQPKTLENAMGHRPTRTGALASDISQEASDMGIPKFYEHPEYYHFGGKEYDESVNALMKIKGKPDATITIYRSGPKNQLRTGDWVTLSKEKARLEGLDENTKVHSFKVKANEVEFAGDDITEFGYWGNEINIDQPQFITQKRTSELTRLKQNLEEQAYYSRARITTMTDEGLPPTSIQFEKDNLERIQSEINDIDKELSAQPPLFIDPTDYRTGKAIFNIDTRYDVIRKRFYELARNLGLANAEAELVSQIMTDQNGGLAQAAAFKNVASFEALVSRFAAEHEMGHLLFQRLPDGTAVMDNMELFKKAGITRQQIIDELKAQYKINDEAELEERLMVDFEVYTDERTTNKPATFTGTIKKFFDIIFTALRRLFAPNKINATQKFYNTILDADEKIQNFYLPERKTKYAPINGILDYSFGKQKFIQKKPDITDITAAKNYVEEARESYEKTEEFAKTAMTEEMKAVAKDEIHIPLVKAIKNSYLYRKEKTVGDTFNHATLMKIGVPQKNGTVVDRYVITNDPASYRAKGYQEMTSVDEIYSNDQKNYQQKYSTIDEMIEDMVAVYNEPVRSTNRIIDEELEAGDVRYREAKAILEQAQAYYAENNALQELIRAERREMKQEEKIKQMKSRAKVIGAIADYFKLDRQEMAQITRKDFRTMGTTEFDAYVKELERQAEIIKNRNFEFAVLQSIISSKNLKNVDNFRQAMELPPVDQMSTEQLQQFQNLLNPYQQDDEFLSLRLLETLPNTPLAGITTVREGMEVAAKQIGILKEDVATISQSIFGDSVNKMRTKISGDTTLARLHPFFQYLVDRYNTQKAREMLEMEQKRQIVEGLAKAARKSRPTTITEKIGQAVAPTDDLVFDYLSEADPVAKDEIANQMTMEEVQYAEFIADDYAKAYAHLLEKEKLGGSRFVNNYITNIAQPILESIKNGNLKDGIISILNSWRGQQATLNILQADTQNILPYEKFFKYSLTRTGNILPTKNVARAYLSYIGAYHNMRALDSLIPEMMMYARLGSPTEKTEHGLERDRRLMNFVKSWINNKKGRKEDFGGYIPQGGAVDVGLRMANTFMTTLHLGFSPMQVFSVIGEKTANLVNLGAKQYTKGVIRARTKQGKMIEQKYKSFTGQSLWEELTEATKSIGDKAMTALFAGFQKFQYDENVRFLLGAMTDQEFKAGELTPERLAELRRIMGRYRVIPGSESIIGSTSVGKTYTKYRTWALPWIETTLSNINTLRKGLAAKQYGPEQAKAVQELTYITIMSAMGYLSLALLQATYGEDEDKKNSLAYKYMKRAISEAMSFIGGVGTFINPFSTTLTNFLAQLDTSLRKVKSIDASIREQGVKELQKQFTPSVLKQLDQMMTDEQKDDAKERLLKAEQRMNVDIELYNQQIGEQQRAGLLTSKEAEKLVEDYANEKKAEFEEKTLDENLKYLIEINKRGNKELYKEIGSQLSEYELERLAELWYIEDKSEVESMAKSARGDSMDEALSSTYTYIDQLPYSQEQKDELRYKAQRAYKLQQTQ